MLRLVRMTELANRATSQISGGQQQRVALARALAPHPEVLLLDEPLSALDLKLRKAMQIELKRLQRDTGITFVFVTHDQEEALTMSDRIAVMSHGQVRQIGNPREIYDHPAERFVADFIGEANMLAGELVRTEGATGWVRLAPDFEVVARVPIGRTHRRPGHRRGPTGACDPDQRRRRPRAAGHARQCGLRRQRHPVPSPPRERRRRSWCAARTAVPTQRIHRPGDRLCVLLGDHSVQVLRD